MQILDSIRQGDRLDLRIGDEQYRTKVVQLESSDTFVVVYLGAAPIPAEYAAGTVIDVANYHPAGKDNFAGQIVYRGFKHGDLPAMRVKAISDVVRTQRRDFYRLPLCIPVEFLVLSRETITTDSTWHEAESIDIGEGGMLLASQEGYAVGYELECRFKLGDMPVSINSSVRRSDFDVTSEGGLAFTMGLQFTSGSVEIKQHIAKFVMQHQTRARSRVK